ncbi:MAG: DivIVA domain-containing protein [Clostridia bacterium]|nr:DivIVA domain-containing protein [Clostridia bacterium]
MAITIKDIHEKEFTKQVRGYSIDEVDDFLDELADQMEAMVKENREMASQLEALKNAPPVEAAPAPAPVATPVVEAAPQPVAAPLMDEPQYFKNLETTLRETLINAQRLADETVAEARKKANGILSSAEEQAASITANAKAEAETTRAESAELKANMEDYRSRFVRLLQDQAKLLKSDETLFTY